eukprot:Skav215477  [mRNA]  locus=scaffold4792:74520:84921:+ [translate_table: standard]
MQQRTTLNLNRAVLPEDQAVYQGHQGHQGHGHQGHPSSASHAPAMNVPSGTNSVLSPMSAYFDGPPSFFPGAAASSAPPGEAPAREPAQQVVPPQVCIQAAGLPPNAAPLFPFGAQNLQAPVVSSAVTMAPVSPGLQPMGSLPASAGASTSAAANPTLLQSRAPKKENVTKEETKRPQQGRAPCPIGVYVDLSSLRLREKK